MGWPRRCRPPPGRAALPTGVEAEGIGRYPQQVEAAVYFCCLEALQNAAKHAGDGAEAMITVWEDEGALLFEVRDDGAGFDLATGAHDGHGFVNMGDRVGAIGGNISVESAPGQGTAIRGRIPLADAAGLLTGPSRTGAASARLLGAQRVGGRGPPRDAGGHDRDQRRDHEHRHADQHQRASADTVGTDGMPCQSTNRATRTDR